MKTPISLAGLRDLALMAGSAALTAMALQELTDTSVRRARALMPDVAYGWLYTVSSSPYADRPQRLRPATQAEAEASAQSRAEGWGGYIGQTEDGELLHPNDPRYHRGAGRHTALGRIDVVWTDPAATPPENAPAGAGRPIEAGQLLDEADELLAGTCTCPDSGFDPWCPAHTAAVDLDGGPEADSETADSQAAVGEAVSTI